MYLLDNHSCLKLKKDYIPGLGNCVHQDLTIVGGRWEKNRDG